MLKKKHPQKTTTHSIFDNQTVQHTTEHTVARPTTSSTATICWCWKTDFLTLWPSDPAGPSWSSRTTPPASAAASPSPGESSSPLSPAAPAESSSPWDRWRGRPAPSGCGEGRAGRPERPRSVRESWRPRWPARNRRPWPRRSCSILCSGPRGSGSGHSAAGRVSTLPCFRPFPVEATWKSKAVTLC